MPNRLQSIFGLALVGFMAVQVISGAEAREKVAPLVDWALLDKTVDQERGGVWRPAFPRALNVLDGKRVRIRGHVIGDPTDGGREVLIGAHVPGCTCITCAFAKASLFALAHLRSASPLKDDHVLIEGRLHLIRDGQGPLYYALVDAEIIDDAIGS
jgi:hypothetical protein